MTATVTHIDRNFDDARALLAEARNYLAYGEPAGMDGALPAVRLQIGYETMRVTARLLGTMARLLVAHAVRDGQLTQEQSHGEDFAVRDNLPCLDPSGGDDENLPKGLRSLLERSHSLYARVARLEALSRADAA